MATILAVSLVVWKPIGYAVFAVGMFIEGELFLFTAFFLVQQGFFDPLYMLLMVFVGVTVGDIIWYRLGMKISDSASRIARWAEKLSKPFDQQLSMKPMRAIMVSKFIYGVHHAILLRAGMLKLDFQKFLTYDFRANIIWIIVVGGLGYASGASFVIIKHYLRFAEIAVLASFIVFIALERLVAYMTRGKL